MALIDLFSGLCLAWCCTSLVPRPPRFFCVCVCVCVCACACDIYTIHNVVKHHLVGLIAQLCA